MSRINETRQIIRHETCKCICRLTSAVCNSRQLWNKDKCRCKCKEDLANKMTCDKGYIWNPSNCADDDWEESYLLLVAQNKRLLAEKW